MSVDTWTAKGPTQPDLAPPRKGTADGPWLERRVQQLLFGPLSEAELDDAGDQVRPHIEALAAAAGTEDADALRVLHSILYRINAARIALPWEHPSLNVHHPLFARIRRWLEAAWDGVVRRRASLAGVEVPKQPEEFREFAARFVAGHRSSELHPLFPFLRDRATYEQLREFHYQETPFDLYFADILCLIMAGLPGRPRIELARNYWDEVGRGNVERTHRNLRLRMMRHFGISERITADAVETFAWEELALANLYFRAAFERPALLQAVGMMLATELAVPGRVECQLEGCRRVGIPEEALDYLREHVTVDVGHARGWMDEVVLPIMKENAAAGLEVTIGMANRLYLAGAVCDRMLRDLPSVAQ